MTENSAIFDTRHGAGSSHPHRQPAPTAQVCLNHGNGVNWRATRRLSGECRLNWYLRDGKGSDFVEDDNIKDWLKRDSGIRRRLKLEIFGSGRGNPRTEGHFSFPQVDYAQDADGQDFRFAFGRIDQVDFEVDLSQDTVRVWFQDRYEWHPFYPGLYSVKTGDKARVDNCVHAAFGRNEEPRGRRFLDEGGSMLSNCGPKIHSARANRDTMCWTKFWAWFRDGERVQSAALSPQDAVPGDPQRTCQRRANPILSDPLHLAPESTEASRYGSENPSPSPTK
jgi:hypothetical protein